MNKYNAKRITIDGYKFDSLREGARYEELCLLQRAGVIKDLKVHPKFLLQERFVDNNGKTILPITYYADFQYIEKGKTIVEDVKGGKATQTRHFNDKAKIFKHNYPTLYFRIIE